MRLKGGDPFLFGRGMEEVDAVRAAGFDVEVVPGISSALAAPALAGIAVTERHVSAQVTIVSGHRVDGDNDWPALARADGTLVVLMAATTGPAVALALVDGGLDAATPVAVVVDASRPAQATLAHGPRRTGGAARAAARAVRPGDRGRGVPGDARCAPACSA